jgi:hypothetical protein
LAVFKRVSIITLLLNELYELLKLLFTAVVLLVISLCAGGGGVGCD